MTHQRLAQVLTPLAAVALACGIFALAWLIAHRVDPVVVPSTRVAERPAEPPIPVVAERAPLDQPPPLTPPSKDDLPEMLDEVAVEELRQRRLSVPVSGVERRALTGSFDEQRGTHKHEAIDILAPRNTPVVAVEDGTIARLFFSEAGGTTVYQFDPAVRYVYYYAHLERYARGLTEKGRVVRGQVIGYVGTSGNAPTGTPHLHFAIFKLTEQKRWWEGAPIDPLLVLTADKP
jgi:murein DD-endopeptidase MepM/ murein hydrolase activator NlpD